MNLQHPKVVLVTIALLFFAPLLLAVLMRSSWWDFEPAAYSNKGVLVEPPLALPLEGLRHLYPGDGEVVNTPQKWIMMYPFPRDCNERCNREISALRQIHIATGRDQSNVAIWLITPETPTTGTLEQLANIYTEFGVLKDTDLEAGQVLSSVSTAKNGEPALWESGQVFLLDPAANIILRYVPGQNPNDINRDLDRLLKWSAKD